VSPTGKQNAFASRAKASYAAIEIGEESPRTLGSAFQHAIGLRRDEGDQIAASVARLQNLRAAFARAYDETFANHLEMNLADPESASLGDIVAAARAVFETRAAA
jgi:CRISPR system Cascade subunit CasC